MSPLAKLFRLPSTIFIVILVFSLAALKLWRERIVYDSIKFTLLSQEYTARLMEIPFFTLTCYVFSGVVWYNVLIAISQ